MYAREEISFDVFLPGGSGEVQDAYLMVTDSNGTRLFPLEFDPEGNARLYSVRVENEPVIATVRVVFSDGSVASERKKVSRDQMQVTFDDLRLPIPPVTIDPPGDSSGIDFDW